MPFNFWEYERADDRARREASLFEEETRRRWEEQEKGRFGGLSDFLGGVGDLFERGRQAFRQPLTDVDEFRQAASQTFESAKQGFGQALSAGQERAGGALGAGLRGLNAFQENVALPVKGIATTAAAAPLEAGVSALDSALTGKPFDERSTTLSEILAPRLRGETTAEEAWKKMGEVGDWRYGDMAETRENLPGPARAGLEIAGLASEITNPAYGPLKASGTGAVGKAERGLMAAVDPVGQVLLPKAAEVARYTWNAARGRGGQAISPVVGLTTRAAGGAGDLPPAPWRLTRAELENYSVPSELSDSSRNPRDLARLRDEMGTLADVTDEWTLNDFLGRGYDDRYDVSRSVGPQVKRGQPITVYRTTDAEEAIFPGAYVTPSRRYAVSHGERAIEVTGAKPKLLQITAYPDELVPMNPNEFFYVPRDLGAYHRQMVEKAIKEGRPVPQTVLDEYPDLADLARKNPPYPQSPHDLPVFGGLGVRATGAGGDLSRAGDTPPLTDDLAPDDALREAGEDPLERMRARRTELAREIDDLQKQYTPTADTARLDSQLEPMIEALARLDNDIHWAEVDAQWGPSLAVPPAPRTEVLEPARRGTVASTASPSPSIDNLPREERAILDQALVGGFIGEDEVSRLLLLRDAIIRSHGSTRGNSPIQDAFDLRDMRFDDVLNGGPDPRSLNGSPIRNPQELERLRRIRDAFQVTPRNAVSDETLRETGDALTPRNAVPETLTQPPRPGFVRLYRGEALPPEGAAFEPRRASEADQARRWFSPVPGYALDYVDIGLSDYPAARLGRVSYVDVPIDVAREAFRTVDDLKDWAPGSLSRTLHRGQELVLPEEWARQARPVWEVAREERREGRLPTPPGFERLYDPGPEGLRRLIRDFEGKEVLPDDVADPDVLGGFGAVPGRGTPTPPPGDGGRPPSPPADLPGEVPAPPPGGPLGDPYRDMLRNPRRTEPGDRGSLIDRARDAWTRIWEGTIDSNVRIRQAGGRLPGVTRESAGDLYDRFIERGGFVGAVQAAVLDARDEVVRAVGDRSTFGRVKEDAGTLLLYKRALDRAEKGIANPRSDVEPWLNDPEALRRKIAEVEDEYTRRGILDPVRRVENTFQRIGQKLLDDQVAVGNLSAEDAARIRAGTSFWAHFDVLDKLAEQDGAYVAQSLDRIGSGIQRLTGTTKDVDDPFTALLQYVGEQQARTERKRLLNDTVRTFADYLPRVNTTRPVATVGPEEAARLLGEAEEAGTATVFRPGQVQGAERGYVHLKEDGRWVTRQIKPEVAWLEGILNSDNPAAQSLVVQAASKLSTPVRLGAVVLNPNFIPANAVADMFQAYVVRGLAPFGPSWLRGFATMLGVKNVPGAAQVGRFLGADPETMYREFLRNYGGQSTFVEQVTRERVQTDIASLTDPRSAARKALDRVLSPALGGAATGATAGAATAEGDEDRLGRAITFGALGAVAGRTGSRVAARAKTERSLANAVAGLNLPKDLAKAVGDLVVKPLHDAGMVVEAATRLGVYDKLTRQGLSPREAARAARMATVDFAQGGNWTKEFNAVVPFLNASIQGNRTVLRAVTHDKAAAARLGTIALAAAGLWWLNHRDDERRQLAEKVPSYIRDNDLYVVLGKHTDEYGRDQPFYVRLPLRAVKQIVTPVEKMLDAAYKAGDKDLPEKIGAILTAGAGGAVTAAWNLNPIHGVEDVAPPVVSTALELGANYDPFRRREIEPLEVTDQPKTQRAFPSTTTAARVVAPALDAATGGRVRLSPVQVDYAVGGVAAGGGRLAMQGVSEALEAAGIRLPEVARDLPNPAAAETTENRLARAPVVGRFVSTSGAGQREQIEKAVGQRYDPETFGQVRQAQRAAAQSFEAIGKDQERLDTLLQSGRIDGSAWRAERRRLNDRRSQIMRDMAAAFPSVPETPAEWREYYAVLDTVDPRDKTRLQVEQFRAIEPPEGPDGLPDIGAMQAARKAFLETLTPEERTAVVAAVEKNRTPVERAYQRVAEVYGQYADIPRYRGMDKETGDAVSDLLTRAADYQRRFGRPGQNRDYWLRQVAGDSPEERQILRRAIYVLHNPKAATNPARRQFLQQHPEIGVFFGDVTLADVQEPGGVAARAESPALAALRGLNAG